jgi:hypothetical protein
MRQAKKPCESFHFFLKLNFHIDFSYYFHDKNVANVGVRCWTMS